MNNTVFATTRSGLGRIGLVVGVVIAAVTVSALPAGANTGHVSASQTCSQWSVSVTLDNNVTSRRFVEITSTLPGTTNMVDAHYSTIGAPGTTLIWSAGGPSPARGTVTLTILNRDRSLDSTAFASITPVENCTPPSLVVVPTTLSIVPTTAAVPATTEAPTSTSEASSTTVPNAGTTQALTATSIAVSPVTAIDTTTVGPRVGPVSGTLPSTGSGTLFPILFGLSALASGAVLTIRHGRRAWSRT